MSSMCATVIRVHLVVLAALGANAVTAAEDTPSDLDALVQSSMQRAGVEGLAVVVVREGRVVRSAGYGTADIATGERVTPQTTFQAASLGKVSVAYAVMILAERGLLSLEAPLVDARLQIAAGCTRPTLAQALAHVTGMGNDLQASTFHPDCVPGAHFRYSGEGYLAVGAMIEAATRRSAFSVIDERVFAPLGMRMTRYGPPVGPSQARGHASVLTSIVGTLVTTRPRGLAIGAAIAAAAGVLGLLIVPTVVAARRRGLRAALLAVFLTVTIASAAIYAGLSVNARIEAEQPPGRIASSLSTNAEDMGKFVVELLEPTLMTTQRRDAMFTAVTSGEGCIQWGLGIGIDACAERTTFWQWGSNLGFQSLLVLDPQRRGGVVVLTNTGGGLDFVVPGRGGFRAAKAIARVLLGLDGEWQVQ